MKGSGIEVLLKIISDLSTQLINEKDLPLATEKIKAGFFLVLYRIIILKIVSDYCLVHRGLQQVHNN